MNFVPKWLNPQKSGSNIRAFRRESGITVQNLALDLGVTPDAIYRWERGKAMPKIDHIGNICAILRKNFEDIFVYE
jgi:DNA-binding XRE family transcriptional regulator